MAGGDKTFIRITNKDIYNEIKEMKQDLRNHMDEEEGKIKSLQIKARWHQRIGIGLIAVVGYIFKLLIGGK